MQEYIVETKICKHCNSNFEITDKDLKFYEKVSPIFAGKKYNIPAPKLCPDCRQQRRLSFRNERKMYKTKSSLSGKEIISLYSPDKACKVYEQGEWWSDKWDSIDYGRDFDFNKGFFEQFEELNKDVPYIGLNGFANENCDYTNFLGNSKDCYYTIAGVENQKVLYSYWMDTCNNCVDCNLCKKCENCYSSIKCLNCYDCFFCQNCVDCNNCYFSQDLVGKSNYWGNKQYSGEEIKNMLNNYEKFKNQNNNIIKKNLEFLNSQESSGDNLINCFDCKICFDLEDSEHCKLGYFGFNMNKSQDFDYDSGSDLIFQSHTGYKNKLSGFLLYGNELTNSYYIQNCFNSSNIFGCIGLRNKSYCIFNKQYTKEEYEILVPKIIEYMMETGEWGEFFPSNISPFGYNESVAMEYFPLSSPPIPNPFPPGEKGNNTFFSFSPGGKDAGKANRGIFNRSDYETPFPKVQKIIPANKLPDDITKIPDDILNWAIECEVTKKPFKIITQELEFYRKHNLPIPRRHPDQRHLDRMALRNPRKLYDRKCDKCGVNMKTSYTPESEEIVYCETCYNKEIY